VGLYQQAGTQYKKSQNWQKAGTAFRRAAELSVKTKDFAEAMSSYQKAAVCYKKCDARAAVSIYDLAADLCLEHGNTVTAAKHYQEIGDLEEKAGNNKAAIHAFCEAVKWHKDHDSNSLADNTRLRIGDLYALEGDYKEAVKIYEEIAKADMEITIRRWAVKDHLFKALLCHFLSQGEKADPLETTELMEKLMQDYCDISPAFRDTREMKLVQTLSNANRDNDTALFYPKVKEYVSTVAPAKVIQTLLSRIKERLQPNLT